MKKLLAVSVAAFAASGVLAFRGTGTIKAQSASRDILPLQLEEQIPVPNVGGRLDHFTADAKRKRLFVSALGNNTVEVIDVFAGKVIRSIKGLSQPQGPLYVPGFDKLYVANAEDGKMRVYDGATYTLKKRLILGQTLTTFATMQLPKRFSWALAKRTAESQWSTRPRTSG